MALLTDEHRVDIGKKSAPITALVSRRDIIKYSVATEQLQDKYMKGDEAPPLFVMGLFSALPSLDKYRPDGIPGGSGPGGPKLPLKRMMAGGTEFRQYQPIRPGDELIGVSVLSDIYEKEGRSGPLIFIVREFKITTKSGEPVIDQITSLIAR
ncbi:MAG: MaoC family dehydratase N-terminal domain-containing protein [Pseudomonadales bacterium]|nr:MaoC family dehydratase N-terminal domain-containing protein [Pseudomonadales bacterium]